MELCYGVFKWTKRECYNKLFLHIHMNCGVRQVALCHLLKPTTYLQEQHSSLWARKEAYDSPPSWTDSDSCSRLIRASHVTLALLRVWEVEGNT